MRNEVEIAAKLILGTKYVVALVGAGMSVESGIPPFRSLNGIWTKLNLTCAVMNVFSVTQKAGRKIS